MEDLGGAQDADSLSEPVRKASAPEVIIISEQGDVVLDATFQNSKETIKSARKAAQARPRLAGQKEPPSQQPLPQARVRLAFRVDLAILKTQSKYFDKLLADSHFREANDIAKAFAALSLKNVKPKEANVADLPWIKIHDDDEATSYPYRERAFADLLRILHGQNAKTSQAQITMSFVTTLAVLADRFDCAAAISKYVDKSLKFKWPVTSRSKPTIRDGGNGNGISGMSRVNENVLRQKILVSWLLNQPMKFQAATRELIMNGSCRWSAFGEEEDETTNTTWWYLQGGLEREFNPFLLQRAQSHKLCAVHIKFLPPFSRRITIPPELHPKHPSLRATPFPHAVHLVPERTPMQARLRLERSMRLIPTRGDVQVPHE
jgi:hypothetical protein